MITAGWIEQRADYRAELFDSDAHGSPSLAELCQTAPRGGNKGQFPLEQTMAMTRNILDGLVDYGGTVSEHFIVRQDQFSTLQYMSAAVISMWERACCVMHVESPFAVTPMEDITSEDFTRRDVRLVVETAAALDENVGYLDRCGNQKRGAFAEQALIKLTAKRGPDFTRRWLSGAIAQSIDSRFELDASQLQHLAVDNKDVIRATQQLIPFLDELERSRIAEQLGISLEAAEALPSELISRYVCAKGEPLMSLHKNWNTAQGLTPAVLAEEFGVDSREIEGFFSPEHLFRTVTIAPVSYMGKLKRTFFAVRQLLATDALAKVLKTSPQAIDEVLPQYIRNACARVDDPVSKIRDIFNNAVRARQETGLSIRMLAHLALGRQARFDDLLPILVEAYRSPPSQVSGRMWAGAVARYPDNPDAQRRLALSFQRFVQAMRPHSLNMELGQDYEQQDKVGDTHLSPEELLFNEQDSQTTLRTLAAKTGIKPDQIGQLLNFFSDPQSNQMTPDLMRVLDQLRSAAGTPDAPDTKSVSDLMFKLFVDAQMGEETPNG